MERPVFHIENIYDVLNPYGHGVNGYLKLKVIQLQDRVAAMAGDGDVLALSENCSQAFLEYLFGLTGVRDVLPIRQKISADLRHFVNARNAFENLKAHPDWPRALERDPFLAPYLPCPPIYEEACKAGLRIGRKAWKTVVVDRVVQEMNDKAVFYRQCHELELPLPAYWYVERDKLVSRIRSLLPGHPSLYVRALRSSGSFANVSLIRQGKGRSVRYSLPELGKQAIGWDECSKTLSHFAGSTHWPEFIISELLDLYASPGTSFAVNASGVRIISHTYQRLTDQRRFFGLIHPIEDPFITRHFPPVEQAVSDLLEEWRGKGYRGYGNVDWMVTKEGTLYFAELNARQTAAMPAINIENRLSGLPQRSLEYAEAIATPTLAIVTGDRIALTDTQTFEEVRDRLASHRLLWEQRDGEGAVIYVPPVGFEHKTAGVACFASSAARAYDLYGEAEVLLGRFEGEPLFLPRFEREVA